MKEKTLPPTILELPAPPPGKIGWPWTVGSPVIPTLTSNYSSWPKISIVTPSYNQGQFIEETIRSVLLQGYPNLEYIIMDGGSKDNSVELIRKYEPWLTYWTSEKDKGQSHAINKGWSLSKGEIVAWINSDDTYSPGAFEQVAEFFLIHRSVTMIYGDCIVIDEKGSFVKSCPTIEFNLKDLVCNKWFIPQQSTFIRRNAIDALGGLREDLHLVMDWEFWMRIALGGYSIRYLPVSLASFRRWGEAKTSSQSERSAQEKISVLEDYFGKERGLPEIQSFKRRAYGNVHCFAGAAYYRKDRRLKAFIHLLKAIRYCPSLLKEKKILKMISILIIGKTLNEKRRDLYYWFLRGMGAK